MSHDIEKGTSNHMQHPDRSHNKRKPPPLPPPPPEPWTPWLMPLVFVADIAIFIYTMLKKLGALDWKLVAEEKEYWRLVSCMWYHAVRIGPLYMVSGLGGSLASALFEARKETISVGAFGALFGLLGAMLSELITNWSNYTHKLTVCPFFFFFSADLQLAYKGYLQAKLFKPNLQWWIRRPL
ncbi:hypothetical protein F3Y22_tig00117026pilonHSYRG00072 [Hibiscus syriacus]|uniref:RHOMBOID-like protein n=1 Tax=Hibiscus syriacus TaxID=106335 RepID=A0A6A2XAY3_HIBSY|nr:hypothetical protein F3Y22_tig00117026pilonHSYRG00072 [Hibiscus syriacus]